MRLGAQSMTWGFGQGLVGETCVAFSTFTPGPGAAAPPSPAKPKICRESQATKEGVKTLGRLGNLDKEPPCLSLALILLFGRRRHGHTVCGSTPYMRESAQVCWTPPTTVNPP